MLEGEEDAPSPSGLGVGWNTEAGSIFVLWFEKEALLLLLLFLLLLMIGSCCFGEGEGDPGPFWFGGFCCSGAGVGLLCFRGVDLAISGEEVCGEVVFESDLLLPLLPLLLDGPPANMFLKACFMEWLLVVG